MAPLPWGTPGVWSRIQVGMATGPACEGRYHPCSRSCVNCGLALGAQVFPGGQVLTVASARAPDAGSYSCVAVSAVGEDRRDIVLQVHSESLAWDRAGELGGKAATPKS